MTTRALLKDSLGWGLGLWLFGYLGGVVLFFVVPVALIGWALTPAAIAVTLWVLLRRVHEGSASRDLVIAATWTAIAVLFDYCFIVLLLAPEDGYYKPDVLLYYALTFTLPLAIGAWRRTRG